MCPPESFRAPPGAMQELEGPAFERGLQHLLGAECVGQCILVAHQSPCLNSEVKGGTPFDGCEGCGHLVLLTPQSWALTEDPEVRVICVECAWTAAKGVEARQRLGLC